MKTIRILKLTDNNIYHIEGYTLVFYNLTNLCETYYQVNPKISIKVISALMKQLITGLSLRDFLSFIEYNQLNLIKSLINDLVRRNFLELKKIKIKTICCNEDVFVINSNILKKGLKELPKFSKNIFYIFEKDSFLILNSIIKNINFKKLTIIIPFKENHFVFQLNESSGICFNCLLLWMLGRMGHPYDFMYSILNNISASKSFDFINASGFKINDNYIAYYSNSGSEIYKQTIDLIHPKCSKKTHINSY